MTPKLCADCRHCTSDFYGLKCSNPAVQPRDLATGERPYANSTREHGACGHVGKLFEPRPKAVPWYARLAWKVGRWLEGAK